MNEPNSETSEEESIIFLRVLADKRSNEIDTSMRERRRRLNSRLRKIRMLRILVRSVVVLSALYAV